jgi:uncharacterized protein YdeI (BOF family)
MRHVLLALIAALAIAAALAGAGFGSTGRHETAPGDLGGFGGPVARARVVPLWREAATPAAPALRRVACATAAIGDTSACFEASTSR